MDRRHARRRLAATLDQLAPSFESLRPHGVANTTHNVYDLVIRAGTIVDGSGKMRFVGDVAIKGEKIVAVGANLPGTAAQEVDAAGKIVTPGWIDVHTHFDAQVCWDPYFAPAPHNGATTVIFGNCGVGFAPMKKTSDSVAYICKLMEGVEEIPTPDLLAGLPPAWEDAVLGMSDSASSAGSASPQDGASGRAVGFEIEGLPAFASEGKEGEDIIPGGFQWETFPEFLDHIESLPHAIDFGSNIPHSCVRAYVMGLQDAGGAPSAEQLQQMAAIVEEGMRAGAMGLCASRSANHRSAGGAGSTGMTGDLAPGFYSTDDELVELGRAVARANKGRVFQCISQMSSNNRPEGFEDPMSLIRPEDGTHCGMDWMRECARMGLTVTPTQFGATREESESMIVTSHRAADEGPGRILPQVGPRSVSVNWGIELPLNPFSRHPTFQALVKDGLSPPEIHEILKDPEMKARLMQESADGLGMRGYESSAADLKVLRGEPGEYEVIDQSRKVAAAAEAAGVGIWEFAYEELVMKGSIFSLPLNRRERSLQRAMDLLESPVTRFGLGDSGAHLTSIMDAAFTSFMLMHFCRDWTAGRKMDLETCVKILTADNADLYGLHDRGLIQEGKMADINIIDFEKLSLPQPKVMYDLPAGSRRLHQQVEGIEATIKSGVLIFKAGQPTGELPGKLLRGPQPGSVLEQ